MEKIGLGISDFKKLKEEQHFYCDKTLFIKQWWEMGSEAILIARPRRFGKTLTASMVRYFFEKTNDSQQRLFFDTAIWRSQEYHQLQGVYPVIFMSLRSLNNTTWEQLYENFTLVIMQEYQRHQEILPLLTKEDRDYFQKILGKKADYVEYTKSLYYLSKFLYYVHNQRVIIILDETDVPFSQAKVNEYYEQAKNFLGSWLTEGIKDNAYLERALLFAILPLINAQEIASLNMLSICTVISGEFDAFFGFTHKEIKKSLQLFGLTDQNEQFKQWYSGYRINKSIVASPWSLLSFIKSEGVLQAYWLATGPNKTAHYCAHYAQKFYPEDFNQLLMPAAIIKEVDSALVPLEIEANESVLWTILLLTGYITAKNILYKEASCYAELEIPNKELLLFFRTFLKDAPSTLLKKLENHIIEE